MSERLSRSPITPPPQREQEAMLRLGLEFEETPDGLVVTYPQRAMRETINEENRRSAVFFVHHYEQRQVTEAYNRSTGSYVLFLRPARFPCRVGLACQRGARGRVAHHGCVQQPLCVSERLGTGRTDTQSVLETGA